MVDVVGLTCAHAHVRDVVVVLVFEGRVEDDLELVAEHVGAERVAQRARGVLEQGFGVDGRRVEVALLHQGGGGRGGLQAREGQEVALVVPEAAGLEDGRDVLGVENQAAEPEQQEHDVSELDQLIEKLAHEDSCDA
ncbi:hypothetical protein D3C72_1743090 [compost metagenome]